MSLPPILKYIYSNASDESIRKGKRIFSTLGAHLINHDTLIGQAVFRVRNDVYANHYNVTINNFHQPEKINVRCQCPYNMGNICRHEAAALFMLHDLVVSGYFNNLNVEYDQNHTVVRMKSISTQFIKLFSSSEIVKQAESIADTNNGVKIITAADETIVADITDTNKKKITVTVHQNEERYFDTQCKCDEKKFPVCVHKAALLVFVLNKYGGHYFSTLRNWDTQKNKLLGLYGYSLDDDLEGKFEFYYIEGKPYLKVLDNSIKKSNTFGTAIKSTKPMVEDIIPKQLGMLFHHKTAYYPNTALSLISGDSNDEKTAYVGKVEEVSLNKNFSPIYLKDIDKTLIFTLKKLQVDELVKYVKRNSPFGDIMDNTEANLKNNPDEELKEQVYEFYLPRLQRLLEQFETYPFVMYLPSGKDMTTANMQPIKFSAQKFQSHLFFTPDTRGKIRLELQYKIAGETYSANEITKVNDALIFHNGIMYACTDWLNTKCIIDYADKNLQTISKKDWQKKLKEVFLPLSQNISIDFHPDLRTERKDVSPQMTLQVTETDKMIVFKPIFVYEGVEKQWLDYTQVVIAEGDKAVIVERNEADEQTLITQLRHFHPSMQESRKAASFLLPREEALKGKWYFNFIDKLKEENIAIKGVENLKQTRINPNKPVTNIQITSGIDWFDAEMSVSIGDNNVKLADIKKALLRKQEHITLSDGSIGLFPEEWLQKYGLMIKMANIDANGHLKIKNVNFSVINELAEESGEDETLLALAEKREKITNYNFEKEEFAAIPENVNATLRPYQQNGFRWMLFLRETTWGGILADDMGLGKTLQTLVCLQHYQNEINDARFLVVCPTTLMYNWENEIKKFTPDLTYHIHHGSGRSASKLEHLNKNVIITTYGTLRSDIKYLSAIEFDYIVLDESQAIKNPLSQAAKSALLLNGKNKLALSGTPMQNNTFDLFAQMNFLNPGMLGGMEFFRNEFATPIDKMQDNYAKAELKKLIDPFILRRTKEQVAPDLPDKTEMVLYCEMGAKQRKIYDAYKNSFRSKILGEIEEHGIERSQLSILTGLMKLRQICDSPAILNEAERYENHSVKIEELVRELKDNAANHKVLVFSQFLGMLGLIRMELEHHKIPYVYFDGSSTSNEREDAIQNFQNDEDCRVFLISLKAGGVGLNLTAADYVYIVDPWWNPAVEQQAIDRTHRIGQTKNIFAYRLICKDTIEEKILLLQERKLGLVKDLISNENAFLKKLTKEDVAYLLS